MEVSLLLRILLLVLWDHFKSLGLWIGGLLLMLIVILLLLRDHVTVEWLGLELLELDLLLVCRGGGQWCRGVRVWLEWNCGLLLLLAFLVVLSTSTCSIRFFTMFNCFKDR